jgi:hypothetical protein
MRCPTDLFWEAVYTAFSKNTNDKKSLDHPRASIIAINKKLIAWQDDVIRHSLKTKSSYVHIRAGFKYLFHQEKTLIYAPFYGSEGMINNCFTPGYAIRIIFNPSLHLIQQVFICPAGYSPAIFAMSASILDIAVLA